MSEITANELLQLRDDAFDRAAQHVGHILFAFSRFVTGLHLCVASFAHGADFERHAQQCGNLAVNKLLGAIKQRCCQKYAPSSEARTRYAAWLKQAHEVRKVRNSLVHSRWGGFDSADRSLVAMETAVFVEPARERRYTLEELELVPSKIESLHLQLSRLRKDYPL